MTLHHISLEHPCPSSPSRVALNVLVPLSVVAVINLAVAVVDLPAKLNWGHRLIGQKWKLVEADRPAVDWLVLGDSSGNQSVIPDIIREKTGAVALNACTIGDCLAVGDAWMLAEYIARHGPPKRVVLVHVSEKWTQEAVPTQVLARIPLEGDFWERLVPPQPLGIRDRFDLFAAHWLPLYSQNVSLSDAALKLPLRLLGRERIEEPKMSADGFSAFEEAIPDGAKRDAARIVGELTGTDGEMIDVRVSHQNILALQAIASMAERYGFEVDVVTGPVVTVLGENPIYQQSLVSIEKQLREAVGDTPRVRFFITDPHQFAPELMSNADHVVKSGAEDFTHRLLERLRSGL